MNIENFTDNLINYINIPDIKEYVNGLFEDGILSYYYKKFGRIDAKQGTIGQTIITKEGNLNKVKADEKGNLDWIVTNPNGEKFIVPHKTFVSRYETKVGLDGKHAPISKIIRAVRILENISFTASWGKQMNIKAGGFLDITNFNDIYGIQEKDFFETYAQCNKDGIFYNSKLRELFSQDDENSI